MKKNTQQSMIFGGIIIFSILLLIFAFFKFYRPVKLSLYEDPIYGIHVKYPSSWELIPPQQSLPEFVVGFRTSKENVADIFLENVNITVRKLTDESRNLQLFTNEAIAQLHILLGPHMEELASERTTLAGLPAHRFIYRGVVEGVDDPNKYMHVWTIKGDVGYIITYTCLESRYEKYLREVQAIINSLEFSK
jgi:hypothetical protein